MRLRKDNFNPKYTDGFCGFSSSFSTMKINTWCSHQIFGLHDSSLHKVYQAHGSSLFPLPSTASCVALNADNNCTSYLPWVPLTLTCGSATLTPPTVFLVTLLSFPLTLLITAPLLFIQSLFDCGHFLQLSQQAVVPPGLLWGVPPPPEAGGYWALNTWLHLGQVSVQ